MKLTVIIVAIALLVCFVSSAFSWKSYYPSKKCPPGDRVCRDYYMGKKVCYNPHTHSCVRDSKWRRRKLCGKGEGSCRGVCFDKYNYKCKYGKLKYKGGHHNDDDYYYKH